MSTTSNTKGAEKKPSTSSGNSAQHKSFVFGSSTPREFSHMAKPERQSRRNEDPQKSKSDSAHNISFYMRQARSITPGNAGSRTKGWAFGSSTPREFSYLNRLKTEHRFYDTKCTPNEAPKVLISKSAMTLTEKSAKEVKPRPLPVRAAAKTDKKPAPNSMARSPAEKTQKPQIGITKSGGKATTVADQPTKNVPPKAPADKPKTSEKSSVVSKAQSKTPAKEQSDEKVVEITNINDLTALSSAVKENIPSIGIMEVSQDDPKLLKDEVPAITVSDSQKDDSKPEDVSKDDKEEKPIHRYEEIVDKPEENKQTEEENENQSGIKEDNRQHKSSIDFSENHSDNADKHSNDLGHDHNAAPTDETVSHVIDGLDLLNDGASNNPDQYVDPGEPSQHVTIE